MRTPRFAAVVAAIGALLVACAGSKGDKGDPGGTKRTADYCNAHDLVLTSVTGFELTAACTVSADIPVEGWCVTTGPMPADAYLSKSQATNWDDTTKLAGWTCGYSWTTETTTTIPAQANICCAHPQ